MAMAGEFLHFHDNHISIIVFLSNQIRLLILRSDVLHSQCVAGTGDNGIVKRAGDTGSSGVRGNY